MQKLLFSPSLINSINSIKLNLYLKNKKMKIIKNYCLIKSFLFILIFFFFVYTILIKNDEKKIQLKMVIIKDITLIIQIKLYSELKLKGRRLWFFHGINFLEHHFLNKIIFQHAHIDAIILMIGHCEFFLRLK